MSDVKSNEEITQRFQLTYVDTAGEMIREDYDATHADILAEAHKVTLRERRPVTIWTREVYATVTMKPVVELVSALNQSMEKNT